MEQLSDLLSGLPIRHREALSWFAQNAGTIQSWPSPISSSDGQTLLATKAKGIYKPAWSSYALSIRQTMGGPYPDIDPVVRPDGTWIYRYFQENPEVAVRDSQFTNIGLMACWADSVPVGVMRQMKQKPDVRYLVDGVALVSNWDDGYFFFEGFSSTGLAHPRGPSGEIELLVAAEAQQTYSAFDPTSVTDARQRTLGQIVSRRGQGEFRSRLVLAYDGRCAITNCDAEPALEAAHITPYLGAKTNRIDNGLLLRADIHTLYDLGLIAVHEDSLQVLLARSLRKSAYAGLCEHQARLPTSVAAQPSPQALRQHRIWASL